MQYFKTAYTNGRTEGANYKIKNIKRRAFGYRIRHRFSLRVFWECTGKTYEKQVSQPLSFFIILGSIVGG
ncbi:transposase [Bacillus xiapuensis]|uniref:transposase n=1 Tax=Bacillus xiapuensis TaxID=2014075 RepID=UPI001E4132F8|nr:transposase [Bacillus xiapuensis]